MVAPVPWLTAHLPICPGCPVAAAAAEQVDRDAMDVDAENETDDDVPPARGCGRVRLPTPPPLHVASPRVEVQPPSKDVPGTSPGCACRQRAPSTPVKPCTWDTPVDPRGNRCRLPPSSAFFLDRFYSFP
ncbi:hypothetical protein AMAG_19524 [Allomyces macrogynus ATCC 38327]|uniref:Uncharacterized protein n=1 Tax=Allomyces macrogynus (strain ATCC 38327) TaxID=578462 RepID=A0A0L0SWC6_ALLM3|nr:hypothetical protein AMAG_19524 [Allomyces macrogynus ATCC 38327]|eukprot:KNE66812.1 hypothetical protein AMAG_19524 [Allomyces macrogynus ATCC 38327]